MTKLEKSPCIALVYEFSVTDADRDDNYLYSKKYLSQKSDELFRLGLKVPLCFFQPYPANQPATIFILTTNLPKTGVKVSNVVSFAHIAKLKRTEVEMKEMDLTTQLESTNNNKMEDKHHQQLFTDPLKFLVETDVEFSEFGIYGRVYLVGIVDNYRVHQMDGLLGQQLWSSVEDQQNEADIKLIANDGKSLPVYKWMLAARSPVFAALLISSNEDVTSLHLAVDCTLEEISQFIRFIYTGELEGLVSQELMQLAVKYGIETLEDICRTAFQDAFSEDRMAMISLHLRSHRSGCYSCVMEEQPDSDISDMKILANFCIYTCTWNVQNLNWTKDTEGQETVTLSVPFEHGGKNLFRAEIEMMKNPEQACSLKFISFCHRKICCVVDEVICYIHQENSSLNERLEMINEETNDEELLQAFSTLYSAPTEEESTAPLACPFVITFKARLRSKIPTFVNKIIDSTWGEQLWDASVHRKMTDVEFLVGEESYSAHRSLLSARSPMFAAMFASGMKEAETGRVTIENVDPTTFQRFLKFLYTGMFEPSSKDRELFTVADKYGVETLMELCRPATQTVDMDHIYKTFLC